MNSHELAEVVKYLQSSHMSMESMFVREFTRSRTRDILLTASLLGLVGGAYYAMGPQSAKEKAALAKQTASKAADRVMK